MQNAGRTVLQFCSAWVRQNPSAIRSASTPSSREVTFVPYATMWFWRYNGPSIKSGSSRTNHANRAQSATVERLAGGWGRLESAK